MKNSNFTPDANDIENKVRQKQKLALFSNICNNAPFVFIVLTAVLYHFELISRNQEYFILILINILFGIAYIITDRMAQNCYCKKVMGVVKSYIGKTEIGNHAPTESFNAYYTTIEYKVGGKKYKTEVRINSVPPKIGEAIELTVDPKDPSDATIPQHIMKQIFNYIVMIGSKAILSFIVYTEII